MLEIISNTPVIKTVCSLFLIGILALVVNVVVNKILRYAQKKFYHRRDWLYALVDTFDGPFFWVIWGSAAVLGAETVVFTHGLEHWVESLVQVRRLLLVGALTWVFLRWKQRFVGLLAERLTKKGHLIRDRALIGAFNRVASIVIATLAGLTALDTLGVPVQALIAFGGLGSIAVSWAAKDVIANFFGGLMIYLNRPFWEGNWIRSTNKGFEGVVEEIGWYMTRIRTFERRPMYVPNALMTDAIIENPGRMYNRRIKTTVGVRYCDVKKVTVICNRIEAMLKAHEEIDQKQILMVHLIEFGPYSLNIEIYTFTKTTNWQEWRRVQQDVMLKVAAIIEAEGAEIAFPTSSVHLHNIDSLALQGQAYAGS